MFKQIALIALLVASTNAACDDGTMVGATCKPCSADCYACTKADDCSLCYGAILADNKCEKKCAANCGICTVEKECTTCVPGFFVKEKLCVACSAECTKCSDDKTCTECGHGFNLVSNACVKWKIENCNYESDAKCISCKPDYQIKSDGTCEKLKVAGCSAGSATEETCTACQSGYLPVKENKCTKCDVANCLSCSAEKKCESCASGFYAKADACVETCEVIYADGKKECSSVNLADKECISCSAGHYKDTVEKCVKCHQSCKTCDTANKCIATSCAAAHAAVIESYTGCDPTNIATCPKPAAGELVSPGAGAQVLIISTLLLSLLI